MSGTYGSNEATMGKSAQVLVGMAAAAGLALIAFSYYRWQQRRRVRRVEEWVKDFLAARYGEAPQPLHIDCSDDKLWPVLVSFLDPRTGIRHRLRFSCWGRDSTFSLLEEKAEHGGAPPVGMLSVPGVVPASTRGAFDDGPLPPRSSGQPTPHLTGSVK
jgi:hypothetical protein